MRQIERMKKYEDSPESAHWSNWFAPICFAALFVLFWLSVIIKLIGGEK